MGDYNQLFKNSRFKNTYKNIIDTVIKSVVFDGINYKYGYCVENELYGVLEYYRGKWRWSWMNTINTNYSCLDIIVNGINKIVRVNKNTDSYFKFNGTFEENMDELNKLRIAIVRYQNTIFIENPVNPEIFNKMKFKTQETWYKGLISVIFFLENINNYFDGNITFKLDYSRGNKDDMGNSIDIEINVNGKIYKSQHKTDYKYDSSEGFDFYGGLIYDDKYRELDLLTISHFKENQINVYYSCKTSEDGGNFDNFLNQTKFKIKHNLMINQKMGTENTNILSTKLYELVIICCDKHINFDMGIDDSKINKIIHDEYGVYVVYNNIYNQTFIQEIDLLINEIKNTD